MAFEASSGGSAFTMDATSEFGGKGLGPTPVEALFGAIAACSAMDVISILEKKQQKVTSYSIEVEGSKKVSDTFPKPIEVITVKHIVKGDHLDEAAVKRAVELSDEKYCTVVATLRSAPEIKISYEIQ